MFMIHAAPMITLLGREGFLMFHSEVANRVAIPIFGLVGVEPSS